MGLQAEVHECAYHRGRQAVAICKVCRNYTCERCIVVVKGKQICKQCFGRGVDTTTMTVVAEKQVVREQRRQSIYRRAALQHAFRRFLLAGAVAVVVGFILLIASTPFLVDFLVTQYSSDAHRNDPWAPEILYNGLEFLFFSRQYDQVIVTCDRVQELFPKDARNARALYLQILTYQANGNSKQCLARVNRFLDEHPTSDLVPQVKEIQTKLKEAGGK